MRLQEVKINLKNGKIKIDLDGFQGAECDSIKAVEDTLGTINTREVTDEAFIEVQELPEFVKQGI